MRMRKKGGMKSPAVQCACAKRIVCYVISLQFLVPAVTPPVIQPQFAAYTVGEADVEVIICVQASNAIDEIVVSFTTQNDQAIGK